jgi:hypothetical protein
MGQANASNGYTYVTSYGEVRVDGLAQIRDALRGAGEDLSDLKKLMHSVGDIVADEARRTVPVRTGRLKRSIRANSSASRMQVKSGDKRSAPYAGVINYGWRAKNIPETDFMQNAETATAERVDTEFQRSIRELLQNNHINL